MSTQTVIQGTLKPDGTLELDSKPNLPSGRVQVTLTLLEQAVSQAKDRIASLAKLAENWDSYGSPPIQRSAIETATRLLETIRTDELPTPHICPVSGGGIGITWEVRTRRLEIEILPNGAMQYVAITRDKLTAVETAQEGSLTRQINGQVEQQVGQLIDWLLQG